MEPRAALLACAILCAGCHKPYRDGPDYLVRHDTESHAVAGAIVTTGIDYILRPMPQPWRGALAVGTAGAAGVLKEMTDQHFSAKDAAMWVVGGGITFAWTWTY